MSLFSSFFRTSIRAETRRVHMLIKTLILRKTLSRYHDKHEIEYLKLFNTNNRKESMKYSINLIKLFCVFTKRINQFKLFIIHQMFEIYDKLFDRRN